MPLKWHGDSSSCPTMISISFLKPLQPFLFLERKAYLSVTKIRSRQNEVIQSATRNLFACMLRHDMLACFWIFATAANLVSKLKGNRIGLVAFSPFGFILEI